MVGLLRGMEKRSFVKKKVSGRNVYKGIIFFCIFARIYYAEECLILLKDMP